MYNQPTTYILSLGTDLMIRQGMAHWPNHTKYYGHTLFYGAKDKVDLWNHVEQMK